MKLRSSHSLVAWCLVLLWSLLPAAAALAGSLDAPAAPTDAASDMYTLEDLYNRLDLGTAGAKTGVFDPPAPGNPIGPTGHTTDQIMAKAPTQDAQGATAAQVRLNKTYFGLSSSGWGLLTGTMQDRTITPPLGGYNILAGYYSAGINLLTAEPALLATNIAYNVAIFGVTGSVANIVNTTIASGGAVVTDILPGKIAWVNGASITGSSSQNDFSGAPGSISFAIPDGYYSGKTATAVDADLDVANIKSGVVIFGTTGTMIAATGDAAQANVLSGTSFSSASAGSGVAGTMPNNGAAIYTPTTSNRNIAAGYHNGSGYVAGDAGLVSANIKSGATIFGVAGNANVVNTAAATATAAEIASGKSGVVNGTLVSGTLTQSPLTVPARPPKTGQTTTYATGDDGHLRTGAGEISPRFKDNNNGTITDLLTGLIWLKNANCFGVRTWTTALNDAITLANGACGLTDGSVASHWRLPNRHELRSLTHAGYLSPSLTNTAGTAQWTAGAPFTNVQSNAYAYWSSTTYAGNTADAWFVYLFDGNVFTTNKASSHYVWPVRGGQ